MIKRQAGTIKYWQECVLVTSLYFHESLQICSEIVHPLVKTGTFAEGVQESGSSAIRMH